MVPKVHQKERVIALRRKGYTYREILNEVPVSKGSISLWLKDTPLSEREKKILKDRKSADISRWRLRAAESRRKVRDDLNKELFIASKKEFLNNINNPLFQVGITLYWAEGAKRNTTFSFINSDADMVQLMLVWIRKFLVSSEDEIKMRVFTHKAFEAERHDILWSEITGIPLERFGKTIFKTKTGLTVKKRPNYIGCARIELGKVKYLRKMLFWQEMLIGHYKRKA